MSRYDRFFHRWGDWLYGLIATLAAALVIFQMAKHYASTDDPLPRFVANLWFFLMVVGLASIFATLGRLIAVAYLSARHWYLNRKAVKVISTI